MKCGFLNFYKEQGAEHRNYAVRFYFFVGAGTPGSQSRDEVMDAGQGTTEGQEIRWPKVRCVTDHTQLKRRRAAETTMYPWNDVIKRRCQRRPGGFRRHHPRRRRGRIHRKEIEIHKTISRTSDLGKTSEKTRNVPHWKKTLQKIVLTKSTDSGKFEARFRKKEKTRKRTTLKKNTTKKLIH